MKKDIESFKDVQTLVDKFYLNIRKDTFIGPIFNLRLSGSWEMHHRKLYRFWHTVLLRRPDYFGNPVPIHFSLNLDDSHFACWLDIWNSTVEENFQGKIAERAKYRAKTMAASFMSRIRKGF